MLQPLNQLPKDAVERRIYEAFSKLQYNTAEGDAETCIHFDGSERVGLTTRVDLLVNFEKQRWLAGVCSCGRVFARMV